MFLDVVALTFLSPVGFLRLRRWQDQSSTLSREVTFAEAENNNYELVKICTRNLKEIVEQERADIKIALKRKPLKSRFTYTSRTKYRKA